jgi:2-amino-4-hydroxy-6-hydroxymethyldihydropteridine diphosphokinase
MSDMQQVFIGLGGNVGEVSATINLALLAINEMPQTTLLRCSRHYRTPAWGNVDQPNFINAVAECHTQLAPEILLEKLLLLEQGFGRERSETLRWQPRRLDLDILLYGEQQIDSIGLTIPHPHMHERAFVLVPLAELAPQLQIPGVGLLKTCLEKLDITAIQALDQSMSEVDHV